MTAMDSLNPTAAWWLHLFLVALHFVISAGTCVYAAWLHQRLARDFVKKRRMGRQTVTPLCLRAVQMIIATSLAFGFLCLWDFSMIHGSGECDPMDVRRLAGWFVTLMFFGTFWAGFWMFSGVMEQGDRKRMEDLNRTAAPT